MTEVPQPSSARRPIEAVSPAAAADPTWDRLEDQITWYSIKSARSGRNYRLARVVSLLAAAFVPFTIGTHLDWVGGALGITIVTLEGIREVYRWERDHSEYARISESLKHERYLYLAQSGPYSGEDPHRTLAERLEGLIGQGTVKYQG
jgi:hypothetical protein